MNIFRLLTILCTHVGEEIAAITDSTPTDMYPLLICLSFDNNQIKVESVIQGMMSNSEVLGHLIQARDTFNVQNQSLIPTNYSSTNSTTENWTVPPSTLTEVVEQSNE